MKRSIVRLGIDLAKTMFHVCGMDRGGNILVQRRFRRAAPEVQVSGFPVLRGQQRGLRP